MRFPDRAGGEELQGRLQAIADATFSSYPKFEGLPKTELWSVLHRPVKPPHPKVDELISQAMGISALVGEPIIGARYSGGGTDGSIAQGVGLPTIDSLGLDGTGAHSSREESTVESLIARVKLAAVLLARHVER
jgi:glutamate carboxypeptidase